MCLCIFVIHMGYVYTGLLFVSLVCNRKELVYSTVSKEVKSM